MSEATTPTGEVPVFELDDRDAEPRTPMKRLGSTRKLAAFNILSYPRSLKMQDLPEDLFQTLLKPTNLYRF
ncbi:hypothetical protein MSG28_004445 [Choristoneura fumiferana]|uniref:Uncharacterized protein n=1 Tax=Choristoneura fumiferana TaxID=7141 RepID=A0ACC0K5X8_CHOFU|nr:hypothetical protein MSG28_004445 [Choristoneura fumiferana]